MYLMLLAARIFSSSCYCVFPLKLLQNLQIMQFPRQFLPISRHSIRYFASTPSHSSPAFSSTLTRPPPSTSSSTPLNLLYLNVSHSPNSLVAVGARALLEGIKREHKVKSLPLILKSVETIENSRCVLGPRGGSLG